MTSADLDGWARRLAETAEWAAAHRSNETELREDLDPVVRSAVAELYGLTDREITAERRAGKGRRQRRYDKAYGGLVVEWEWSMDAARRRHGAEQAVDYLGEMRADLGVDRGFSAVVTDGQQWGFLSSDFPHAQLSLVDPEPEPDERFQWRENSAAACRRFLVLIGSNRQSAVTAGALANAFGPRSDVARRVVALLCDAMAGRVRADRADTLYSEWRRSLEVVYGNLDDDDESLAATLRETFDLGSRLSLGELLFSVHTYFALIVRLVAIEVLGVSAEDEDSQPTSWSSLDDVELRERLRAIDAGEIPRGLEIQNLFEGDVFSWYLGALSGNTDLLNAIREALDTLHTFAMPRISYGANRANDILRDLYLALVPRALRKSLGEFPTPAWLAGACLERLQQSGAAFDKGRVLDPTCGTGTFLMPILRERLSWLRTEKGETVSADEVSEILNSVVGFDINPIAVAAARVNYVTALGDLATVGPLTLPVWRADSILLPDEPSPQISSDRPGLLGHPWTALRTSLPDPFPIPPSLATAAGMAALRRCLEEALSVDDQKESRAVFVEELARHFAPDRQTPLAVDAGEWEGAREVSVELLQQIIDLRDADRNGVWARIIENSFAPLFAGRFDIIVGNPPWLTWTKTPPQWRRAAEAIWKRYGLWRTPREGVRGSTSLASGDMAILVFACALDRYATDDALIGLLTPRALVTGDPGGRAFRQFHLKADPEDEAEFGGVNLPFNVLGADDWSDVRPFSPEAANAPYFLVARPGEKQEFPVPTTRWERAQRGLVLGSDWSSVRPLLLPIPGHSNPVDRAVPTSAWSFQVEGASPLIEGGTNRWTFGKGLDTRGANGVFFVAVLESDKPRSRVLIENDPKAGRNKAVKRSRGWVDSALIHPLLRGRDVTAWSARPSGYIFAPYRPDEMECLLDDKDFKNSYRDGWRWLRGHASVLKLRKPPPTRAWDLDGADWCRLDGPMSHMASGNIVVVRELQQQPAAAVIQLRHDPKLARTAGPLIDHKLMFCAVDSPDEAVYLAAMINSTPMQDLLASFANEIAVSPQTMARLPIPDFDLVAHQSVVDSGREAIEAVEKGDPVDRAKVDLNVLEALGVSGYELGEATVDGVIQGQAQEALDLPRE